MKKIKFILSLVITASLVSCVNSDDYGTPADTCVDLSANITVQDVSALANSTAQQNDFTVDTEDYIEAIVTSSDEGGNFYKSISLITLDGTKGFTIPIDDYNLYTKFEPGRKVFVDMDALYFHYNSQISSLEIGDLFNNYTPDNLTDDKVGRVSIVLYQNVIKRSCTVVNEDDFVKTNLTIAQAKNNANLNMLIEFDAVQFVDESLGKKYFDESLNNFGGATNHKLVDADGNSIDLRAGEYATFATNSIPSGSGKVRGVLTKYNSGYQFMIRTINDVQLTSPRIVPLFEETFSSNYANWTKFSVSGTPAWVLDTQYGNPGNCAKMSGFASSGQTINEDWLVSPSINLSSVSSATLTFQTASRYAGNVLEAKISTNYSGAGNPNAATWANLTATYDTNTGSYVWTNSGSIDISSYTGGNVYIAFKYTCTASAASTWEVDNVKIQ